MGQGCGRVQPTGLLTSHQPAHDGGRPTPQDRDIQPPNALHMSRQGSEGYKVGIRVVAWPGAPWLTFVVLWANGPSLSGEISPNVDRTGGNLDFDLF